MMNNNGMISTDNNMLWMLRMCAEEGKVRSITGSFDCAFEGADARFCLMAIDIADESAAELRSECAKRNIPVLLVDLDKDVLGYIARRIPSTAVLVSDCELAEVLENLMEESMPLAS